LGTEKKEKNPPNPKTQEIEKKKLSPGVHTEHSHWLLKFFIFQTIDIYFQPGFKPFLQAGFKHNVAIK